MPEWRCLSRITRKGHQPHSHRTVSNMFRTLHRVWDSQTISPPNCLLTWKEDTADHPREYHDEKGQHLQVSSHQRASFGMGQVLGSQSPLNNHLENSGMVGSWDDFLLEQTRCVWLLGRHSRLGSPVDLASPKHLFYSQSLWSNGPAAGATPRRRKQELEGG